MFSSCLKNIEPEGLADLRGAKAELLRAQTAVEAANAAKVNADAALVLAQAKVQEAIAKQEEAKAAYEAAVARLKELEVEKQTALDKVQIEQAIAEAQQKMAEAEAKAAKAAADAEIALLNSLKILAQTQIDYDNALKDLALAASTLTDAQKTSLTNLESAVTTARADVNAKTAALESAAVELAYALALVDDEAAQKTAVRIAEFALVKAQAAVEGAVEAEAVAKAALELDPSVTDWEAKADEYQAEIDKLDAEYWKRFGEIEDAMSAMKDSIAVDNNDKPVGVIAVKAADYTKYTGYKFYKETGVFSNLSTETKTDIKIEGDYDVAAPRTAKGEVIDGAGDFNFTATSYTYGKEQDFIDVFENKLNDLAKVNVASFEAQIAAKEAIVAASQNDPVYKYDVTRYNDAVAAYTAGDVLPYFVKYVFDKDYDLNAAVKDYNDAVAVFDAAVKKYHAELEKYSPDFEKEKTAALAAKNKAIAEASGVKYAAYQKAYDDNKVASKEAVKKDADRVKKQADDNYNYVVKTAKTATGAADVEAIKTFVKDYDAETADAAAKAKYEVWNAWNAEILAAENVAATAKKAAEDAAKAAEKANADYVAAKAAADDVYKKAVAKADEAYNKAMADVAAKAVDFTAEYKMNLEEQIMAAATDIMTLKMPAVTKYAAKLTENTDPVDVVYSVKLATLVPTYTFSGVPEFMAEGIYDGTVTTYTFKTIAVADFVDKEYFKTTEVKKLADKLVKIGSADFNYAGYPLVMPSDDVVADYYETNAGVTPKPVLYAEIAAEKAIAGFKEQIAALDQLPAFIKAIEAAQAKFEAFVAEKAAELAADKAEVEAFYARYLPLDEKNNAELDAIDAKYAVIKARYNAMVQVIKDYCKAQNGTPVELAAFVENLKSQCTEAVAALKAAEEAVYTAEKDLEKAKNGLVSAAELAQRAYDQAATDLAIALAKLEGATIALENAIAVIYGVEPVVPETPVTPPADDDTTDEGGEAEGGEAEGGEGEGGEETPAE